MKYMNSKNGKFTALKMYEIAKVKIKIPEVEEKIENLFCREHCDKEALINRQNDVIIIIVTSHAAYCIVRHTCHRPSYYFIHYE